MKTLIYICVHTHIYSILITSVEAVGVIFSPLVFSTWCFCYISVTKMFVDSLGSLATSYAPHPLGKMCSKYLTWGGWLSYIVEIEDLYWDTFDLMLCGIKFVRNSFILESFIFVPDALLEITYKETVIGIYSLWNLIKCSLCFQCTKILWWNILLWI